MKLYKKISFSIIAIFLLLLMGDLTCNYIGLRKCNQSPLSIETFDGSNSPYHPSVLYSDKGWSGYHYIMSETPFYLGLPSVGDNYRDQYEDPSIHFSQDGIHWTKCEKPLVSLTNTEIKNRDYYSDPDLVVSTKGIECWYRLNRRYGKETNQDNIILYRQISLDGIHWENPEVVANLEKNDFKESLGHTVISQTLLYEDAKYKMWFVSGGGLHNGIIEYSEADSMLNNWSVKKKIELRGPKVSPWHQHIMKDNDTYWLTIYDHDKNVSIWKGYNETQFDYVCTPIQYSNIIGSYYSHDLYRACLIKTPDEHYRLYFSADDEFKSYIGIMEGDSPSDLKVVSVDNKNYSTLGRFLKMYFKTRYHYVSTKVKYYSSRLYHIMYE